RGAERSRHQPHLGRIARRDYSPARRAPEELVVERARAGTEGQQIWQKARAEDDFQAFAPALERNVELARAYGECMAEDGQSVYEGLLGDYDYGLSTKQLQQVFGELAQALPPLLADAQARSPRRELAVPVSAQRLAVKGTLGRLGVEPEG